MKLLLNHPHIHVDRAAIEAFYNNDKKLVYFRRLAEFLGTYLKQSQP